MTSKKCVKVTVAMPTYNASPYIKGAIESVLAQNYDSFELLIADDGSMDDTWDIIKRYKKHPRVRYYKNGKNLGVGATRNRLVCLARGKYITPCDADDVMLPGNLKTLSRFLDTHPDIGAVYADILELETTEGSKILKTISVSGQDYRKLCDLCENTVNHAGSMIRKLLILAVGGYDETVYSVDDWSLWLKLAEITRFHYLKGEVYYVWQRNKKSLTRTDKQWHSDVSKIIGKAIQRRYGIDLSKVLKEKMGANVFAHDLHKQIHLELLRNTKSQSNSKRLYPRLR